MTNTVCTLYELTNGDDTMSEGETKQHDMGIYFSYHRHINRRYPIFYVLMGAYDWFHGVTVLDGSDIFDRIVPLTFSLWCGRKGLRFCQRS